MYTSIHWDRRHTVSKAFQNKNLAIKFGLANLWEAPSFPEPDVAFTLSPALPAEVPLDFLAEDRSFPSAAFPSNSVFVCAEFGVYIRHEKQTNQYMNTQTHAKSYTHQLHDKSFNIPWSC